MDELYEDLLSTLKDLIEGWEAGETWEDIDWRIEDLKKDLKKIKEAD